MKERCLWYDISPEKPLTMDALQENLTAEVAVIGGGITGLTTALYLAEQGTNVVLIEAGEIPSGGSGRNVGLVNAGLWMPPDDIIEALGEEKGERINTILGGAPAEVFSLIKRHNIDCQATYSGTLHLAHNVKGEHDLARRAEQFQSRGSPVELLDDDSCYRRLGSRRIRRALLDRRAGTLNSVAYSRGLARAAVRAGARIYTDSPAQGIERQGDDWRVVTTNGSVRAPRVVLATNAYTEDHWNKVRDHFFQGNFFQVASHPIPEDIGRDILPEGQGAWDTRMVLSSMRRDAEGRLILGSLGRGEGRPMSYIRCWADRIQRHYFPQLGKIDWEYTWTGRIAFTPDHTLRIFEPAPGILGVTGYNGRGITTGTVVGKGFAHYLTKDDDSLLPLPIRKHQPIRAKPIRSASYESGFTLYHAGQCLRVIT